MPHSFTPGPWEALKFSQHELQTDFAMVKIGERVHMIGYSDEDKANARLIAAAPELLAALQEVIAAADGKGWEQLSPSLENQRRAVEKALSGVRVK